MRWIERLNDLLGGVVAWFYMLSVPVIAYEVLMRYILNSPTSWSFDLTILLCAVGYLLSGGTVTKAEAHIAVTSLQDVVPPRVKRVMKLFGHLVGIFAMAGLIAASWKSGLRAVTIGERTGGAWDAPTPAIIKPLITVAAVLVLLQLLILVARELTGRGAVAPAGKGTPGEGGPI
ncbi:TRAP transporter small permease (plasmid) [Skermanella sp. TT6]|uniref:TRAP transporter small permease protein n=1 Tax=Skermanella cutis TaxID=2775420 RepID=A0ABX7BEG7_9PROT|nr:TRAP transporter small permease [Skermanella sp. TT6]QQP92782.1 TRAP transporter small permease [Skermanella sp. TT6]